jgi:23S rRNA pseudouridine2605 synthase
MKYDNEEELVRLNKFISHNSKYSRREADKLIEEGRVSLNNIIVTNMATKVNNDDMIEIDNKKIWHNPNKQYTVIVYNKQKGEIVSKNDPQGRKTIFDTLPSKFSHYMPIGRLDYASEGVILLTDDVVIANELMHSNLERIYKIKIAGAITSNMELAMKNGLNLDDATAGAHKNSKIKSMEFAPFNGYNIQKNTNNFSILKVSISEGKNRELRRFFAYFDTPVKDLKRIDFGGVTLNSLPSGKTRYLERKEYQNLRDFIKGMQKQYGKFDESS